jgi:biotin/methionine sulfoxide reductase
MNNTRQALEQMDLVVIHDLFLTATAAMADYVLPVTHFLERSDLITGNDNYLFYSRKILDAPGQALDDFEIFRRLSKRLNLEKTFTEDKSPEQWLEEFLASSEVEDPEEFRVTGLFRGDDHERMGLEAFLRDPEASPLATSSGRIHFDSPEYREWSFPTHPSPRIPEAPPGFPLRLVTPHHRLLINSQNDNLAWVGKREVRGIRIHPADAAVRGIKEGDQVKVVSETGELTTPARLSEEVMPGVAWMTQGSWTEGEQVNRLTSDESTYPSAGSRTHLVWIEVQKT